MAMGGVFQIMFDASTERRIMGLLEILPAMEMYYRSAMRYSVSLVNKAAQENAPVGVYVKKQGGNLRRGIIQEVVSPYRGRVGVRANVPYARRREFGFDNMTDSMGRTFANGDPNYDHGDMRSHMHYLQRAYESSLPQINAAWRSATQLAVKRAIL